MRRGATLVEMAIVLAVVGIMLGGAVVPFRVLDETRQREAEQARLQRAVDAVAGYAIRHRTRKRTVVFEGNLISGNPVEIAAGRPYLPCPDVDGDGFEDRMPEGAEGFMQGNGGGPDASDNHPGDCQRPPAADVGGAGLRGLPDFARHIAVAHFGDTTGGRLGKSSHILRGPGFCQRGFRI